MNPRLTTRVCAACIIAIGCGTTLLSADLFQLDIEFQSDGIDWSGEPVYFSALVDGTDDSDPEEPWESFSILDAGPWELSTSNPLLTLTGSDVFLAYGPTFGWGGMSLEIVDVLYPDQIVALDWVFSGPEWNHDTISGDGIGQVFFADGGSAELSINSWTVTLVPAPSGLLGLLLLPGAVRRRRF